MKQLCLLIGTAVLGILLVSCSAQKRVWYLQDAQPFTPEQIAEKCGINKSSSYLIALEHCNHIWNNQSYIRN